MEQNPIMVINIVLPFLSFIVSWTAAAFVFWRYSRRRVSHLLLWGIGLVMFGIGSFCEAYYGAFGWNPLIFRLWYLFGAILVAAWLGQGTIYLLARKQVGHLLMSVLAIASIYGLVRVFTAELDPSKLTESVETGSELSGHAIVSSGVRILTPFFNSYGTIALVGGAIWSAITYWRKRVMLHRTIGNILIAFGAMLPALGGSFSRAGLPNALYIGELLGVTLIFVGYLRAITPIKREQS